MNGQKMSKSLGNSLLLSDLLDKYSDEAIKFALLQTNYRGDINITDDLFPEAEKHMHDFYLVLAEADEAEKAGLKADGDDEKYAAKADKNFDTAMDDDFNTALALSDLFAIFKEIRAFLAAKDGKAIALANQVKKTYSLLGLFEKRPSEYLAWYEKAHEEAIPENIAAIAEERKAARAAKDWQKSDELREKLAGLGYQVKDKKDGYELSKL